MGGVSKPGVTTTPDGARDGATKGGLPLEGVVPGGGAEEGKAGGGADRVAPPGGGTELRAGARAGGMFTGSDAFGEGALGEGAG